MKTASGTAYETLGKKGDWDGWLLAFTELIKTDFGPEYVEMINVEHETYDGKLETVVGKGTLAKIVIKKSDVEVFHDDGCFAVRQGNRTINLNSKETMSYIAFHFKKR